MSDAAAAWRDFCNRMAEIGSTVLADGMVSDDRDRAEGIRHLTRQLTFALQESVEFGDGDFPAFHRFDDDVTKWGGPNADNNYLRCAIDPTGTYRITADVKGCREAIFTLSAGDMQMGHFVVGTERSLRDFEIADGKLEVLVSPDPQPGNWMLSDPEVRQLSIRLYVVDWGADSIPDFYIERVDGMLQRPAPLEIEGVAAALEDAAQWIESSLEFWLRYMEGTRQAAADNTLMAPQSVPGGAADIAYGGGCWNLADDEAWLIEFDPPDAFHWSIQTHTWPWFESGDLAHAQTSLNDQQTHIDSDGKVRVVVSHRDPGLPNWIDTEGRQLGMCVYRWIWASSLPTPVGEVMDLSEVRGRVPIDHPAISPNERTMALAARRRSVHRRFRP
jgi:hypothetical protein